MNYKLGNGRGRHKPQWNQNKEHKDGMMARVDIVTNRLEGTIEVSMPYDEDAKNELKAKFAARWNPEDKTWIIDANDFTEAEVIKELKVHFPGAFR